MPLPYQLTKTILGALLELEGVTDATKRIFANSTLNFKYNTLPDELPVGDSKIAWFGIGINGKKNLQENLSAPYVPSPIEMDLYEPIPFRVVPVDADLTVSERSNYRMRVLKTIEGEDYWCYYLKKLNIIDNQVRIISTNLNDGSETDIDQLDPNNLTPVPTVTTAESALPGAERVSTVMDAELIITGEEVVEAINVLYAGNLLKAHVSEIGIYGGDEKDHTGSDGLGGTITYAEAVYTQMLYKYCNLGNDYSDQSRIETVKIRISSSKSFIV